MVIDGASQHKIELNGLFCDPIIILAMVIDGNTVRRSDISAVKFEGDRIHFPSDLVDLAGLTGEAKINCWLLVVTPGRYRLLRQPTGTATGDLSRILLQIEAVGTRGDILEGTENNEQAGIRARLIDCVVSPQGQGWRVNFPKEAKQLVPEKEERSFVFVFSVAGFVEFWFPDTLSRAVSVPISELLP